jgi:hypothetical protein
LPAVPACVRAKTHLRLKSLNSLQSLPQFPALLANARLTIIIPCIFSIAVTTRRFRPSTPGGVWVYNGKQGGVICQSMELLRCSGVANTHFLTHCNTQGNH